MPRKKVSTVTAAEPLNIPELEDDEQFVEENHTKRTVRKERVAKTPEPEPVEIEAEPVDDDEDEFEPYDGGPTYAEDSIGGLLFDEDSEEPEDRFCQIHVRRNPDSLKDRFRTPATSVLNFPPLRNIDISTPRTDIEEIVREQYGGGHYFFQIRYQNRLTRSWNVSLADLPDSYAPKTPAAGGEENNSAATQKTEPAAVNPIDQFLDSLQKQKQMRDLLFGEELAELQRLRAEAIERANQPPQTYRQNETLEILSMALKAEDKTLADKLLKIAMPEADEAPSHWIVDLVKTGFEHKDELAGIAQMLLGGIVGTPAAGPTPDAIEQILKQQPPAGLPTAPPRPDRPIFRRHVEQPEPEPERTNDDNDTTAGVDADAETD